MANTILNFHFDLQCPVGYKFTIFKHLVGRVTSLIYTQLHLLPWIISPPSRVKWGMMGGSVLGWDVIDQKCGSFTKSLQPGDSTRSSMEILEVQYRAWKYEDISQTKRLTLNDRNRCMWYISCFNVQHLPLLIRWSIGSCLVKSKFQGSIIIECSKVVEEVRI